MNHVLERCRAFIGRLRIKRRDELGREQGQTIIRVAISVCVLAYLIVSRPAAEFESGIPVWFLYLFGFIGLSLVTLWAAFRDTSSSVVRRTTMNVTDVVTISYVMISGGETGIPLFVLYLWITIGNGFRFGLAAMSASAVLSLAGFAVVVWLTPVWQTQVMFSVSVMLALIVLPLYAAHLIVMLNKALESAAKNNFLAGISHELHTPLKNIVGASDVLGNNRQLTPDQRSLIGVIRDSAQRSLKQIENALDLSRLQAGQLVLEPTPCDLHELVNAVIETVRQSAQQKNVRFLVRMAPETPYRLIGDDRYVRDILLDLLSNMVKFTDNGLVYLDVVSRNNSEHKVTVRFELRSTAPDSAPETVRRMFDVATTNTASHPENTTPGASIAHRLARFMGGRIGIDTERHHGSVIWFELPLDKQPDVDDSDSTLADFRALLISEDPAEMEHFRNQITALHGVAISASSKEGLDMLTRSIRLGNPVQALLIDVGVALAKDGSHILGELCDKALSANTLTILVSDIAPPPERLRTWGYNAVLSRRPAPEHVVATLRTAPLRRFSAGRGVVNVPPWLWSRREAKRPRILVADDNRTNLMIVRRMLEQAGYEVDEKQTGGEALESLCGGIYRLAILDMHMPDLSGIDVLRRYRIRCPRSRLPTIILTANVSLDAQQRSADAGADAYLAKPVTAANLLNEVDRLVRESQIEQLLPADTTEHDTVPEVDVVLETEVLAELDRLYHDPRGLAQVIQVYENEGTDLLAKIAQACDAGDHGALIEWIHALKGNAANVGAARLVRACSAVETTGVVKFVREREQSLTCLQTAFTESLAALQEIMHSSRPSPNRHLD